ncbi:MAG TPA: ABC transporter ATP-binding protein [Acidimicrobiales bacterium]|jgi:ABC-type branched-subunit amino acid transport system ATPase component
MELARRPPFVSRQEVEGDALLTVRDLDFSYGSVQVLFELHLQVQRGEALALLGTNGAGKSTLLRTICGLERPGAGEILYEGRNITGAPAEKLAAQGLVLVIGGRGVFNDLTVAENLDMQGLLLRKDRARQRQQGAIVKEIFPILGKRHWQKAGSLSGGEQQQLALAKAILQDPKLLCIDELSLGLAPVVVQQLLSAVRQIHAGGVTVVMVEQSLNIAASICERAVFMERGRIRFEGLTSELCESDDIARAVFLGGPT